jgi:hypothetical protein
MAGKRAERSIGALRDELNDFKTELRIHREALADLSTEKAKRKVYISFGLALLGIATIPASGPFGAAVTAGSTYYGVEAFIEYKRKVRRLTRRVAYLENRIRLREQSIRAIKDDQSRQS